MKRTLTIAVLVALASSLVYAQNVSSSLNGTVVDPSGATVPGARCTLTNQETGMALKAISEASGLFTFPIVAAGRYSLQVQSDGFVSLNITDINVIASERHAMGNVALQVGNVRQSVDVAATAAALQLSSAERSGLVSGSQLNELGLKGRDYFALMQTIPGIVDTVSSRDATSNTAGMGIYINGSRDNTKNIAVDGVTAMDTSSNGSLSFEPNMDSIAEVRVLTSNYQAEYGRHAGGSIMAITKSGTRDFHGSAYTYYRQEDLNANGFFNNRTGTTKQPYRYRIGGYSVGGPVFIPRHFNRDRNKLFFFWSQEFTRIKQDYGTKLVNTPTALERSGDFSKSYNVNGALITVKDPQTGQQFPGNVIPKNRINSLGASILAFYPLPNYTDPDPKNLYRRNFRSVYSGNTPRRNDIIRTDWNARASLQIYYRYGRDTDNTMVPWGGKAGSINYLISPVYVERFGDGHVLHATKTFSPTLVNEITVGRNNVERYFDYQDPSLVDRSKMGNPPYWFDHSNLSAKYIPLVTFGGQPTNPISAAVPFPIPNRYANPTYSVVDGLSKVLGSHNFKAGIYVEHQRDEYPLGRLYSGSLNFSVNATNPLDSGHSFANALLGNFYSYTEGQQRVDGNGVHWTMEWYVQDNWKVTKRMTLDFGVRFYAMPAIHEVNQRAASFDPAMWSAKNAPALYVPALNAKGTRVAKDPISGALAPSALIGLYVPNTGDPANGMFVAGQNGTPAGVYTRPKMNYGPRFGFAYDVFGNGKTAIRGGWGQFYDITQNNMFAAMIGNPPVSYTPTLYFGSLATYMQSAGVLGPSSISALSGFHKVPYVMNFSLGVQQQVAGTVVDASYVGSLGRNFFFLKDINSIPMFARFDPKNADPTQPGRVLSDSFLRPYVGYGSINTYYNGASSNYHSLQVAVNRRFRRGLQYGLAYTFSKALGVAESDYAVVSPYFPTRSRNYGLLSYDRTHALVLNFLYELPNFAARASFRPAHWVADGWQVSAITSFISGAPFTPGFSTTTGIDMTGSAEGARIKVAGDPNLSKGDRTFYQNFNTTAFALPAVGTFGNAGVGILRGPGINNWDVSASKRFPLFSEARYIQIRSEFFNTWNHTQFSGLDTGAQFNPAGQQLNPTFGAFTSARPARMIQLSLRAVF